VAHVELSLTGPVGLPEFEPAGNLDRWCAVVAAATEASLVINAEAVIVAASASCCALFDLGDPLAAIGEPLLGVLTLVDFTAAPSKLTGAELDKIPPLLALSSDRLARGLLRVQRGANGDRIRTVDAVATPIWDEAVAAPRPAGSLTFFAEV
jgi:hypothetical protein